MEVLKKSLRRFYVISKDSCDCPSRILSGKEREMKKKRRIEIAIERERICVLRRKPPTEAPLPKSGYPAHAGEPLTPLSELFGIDFSALFGISTRRERPGPMIGPPHWTLSCSRGRRETACYQYIGKTFLPQLSALGHPYNSVPPK
jgi:hypothetical protein